ncbi:hypothetical protein M770_00605 [Pseudomonas aeruginosa VRFPA03]|nr:hypothetical protein M770_00605 [Pseudomonas aeruginosa VRFPA03]
MGGFMQYSQRLGEAGRNDRRSMRGAFRPGLLPTLVVLGLLPVLLWLGTWQLQRADEKRALAAGARFAAEGRLTDRRMEVRIWPPSSIATASRPGATSSN